MNPAPECGAIKSPKTDIYSEAPHSFRSWCSDTGVPRDLAEMALGHAVRDRTEAAYARSDMLERRRPLMDTWADHIGWNA